jgi:hypothetical protein
LPLFSSPHIHALSLPLFYTPLVCSHLLSPSRTLDSPPQTSLISPPGPAPASPHPSSPRSLRLLFSAPRLMLTPPHCTSERSFPLLAEPRQSNSTRLQRVTAESLPCGSCVQALHNITCNWCGQMHTTHTTHSSHVNHTSIPFTHSLAHSPTHSLAHSPTHSLALAHGQSRRAHYPSDP